MPGCLPGHPILSIWPAPCPTAGEDAADAPAEAAAAAAAAERNNSKRKREDKAMEVDAAAGAAGQASGSSEQQQQGGEGPDAAAAVEEAVEEVATPEKVRAFSGGNENWATSRAVGAQRFTGLHITWVVAAIHGTPACAISARAAGMPGSLASGPSAYYSRSPASHQPGCKCCLLVVGCRETTTIWAPLPAAQPCVRWCAAGSCSWPMQVGTAHALAWHLWRPGRLRLLSTAHPCICHRAVFTACTIVRHLSSPAAPDGPAGRLCSNVSSSMHLPAVCAAQATRGACCRVPGGRWP